MGMWVNYRQGTLCFYFMIIPGCIGLLCMLVSLLELEMVHLCLSICMETFHVLLLCDHDCLCFFICDSYKFITDFVFCWYITMWNWQVRDLIIAGVVVLCPAWVHLWEAEIVHLLLACVSQYINKNEVYYLMICPDALVRVVDLQCV